MFIAYNFIKSLFITDIITLICWVVVFKEKTTIDTFAATVAKMNRMKAKVIKVGIP